MTDVVKLLTSRHAPRPIEGGGAPPRGHDKYAEEQRENIKSFLEAKFMVDRDETEAAMRSLTVGERVHLEIEMREHGDTSHSFDYDPLR